MNKDTFSTLGKYAVLPAILYCIPAIFFIKDDTFSQAWLLYLGNALFLIYIFIFVLWYQRGSDKNASGLNAGFSVTFIGIFFSCMLTLICIFIFAPGLFDIGSSEVLNNTPPALPSKYDHGVLLMLFADIVIGNVVAGSFGSVMASASMRRNKDDKGE